ncbi:MAG: MBG domain-containing protein, partial [Planctomycetia bacterium]|nr:MBG domain-containing protein [Planctomycetia bacterium]
TEVLTGTLVYSGSGKNAGEYTISANGLDAVNYAISYVSGTLTVEKKALTVTVNDACITYGETPNHTVSYAGFVGTDSTEVLTGTLVYSGYTPGDRVGEYTISARGLDATNYSFDYVSGTLTVNQATQTVAVEIRAVVVPTAKGHVATDTISESTTQLNEWDSYGVEFWTEACDTLLAGQTIRVSVEYDALLFECSEVVDVGEGIVSEMEITDTESGLKLLTLSLTPQEDLEVSGANRYVGAITFVPSTATEAGMSTLTGSTGVSINGLELETEVAAVPYDGNRDGIIDVSDLILFAKTFGKSTARGDDVAKTDYNGDGVVDVSDLILFAKNFGKSNSKGSAIILPQTQEVATTEPQADETLADTAVEVAVPTTWEILPAEDTSVRGVALRESDSVATWEAVPQVKVRVLTATVVDEILEDDDWDFGQSAKSDDWLETLCVSLCAD